MAFCSKTFLSPAIYMNLDSGARFGFNRGSDTISALRFFNGVQRSNPETPTHRRFRAVKAISTVNAPPESSSPSSDLEEELRYLSGLKSKLFSAKSLGEKIQVIERQERVKCFFGKDNSFLDFERLEERQMFLLKCLVAIGQEQVLHVGATWLEFKYGVGNGGEVPGSSPIKKAFYVLVNMIEKGEKPGNSRKEQGFLDLKMSENDVKQGELWVALQMLLNTLEEVETFYDCIGGIVGSKASPDTVSNTTPNLKRYQVAVLELILASKREREGPSLSSQFHKEFNGESSLKEFYVPIGPDLSRKVDYAAEASLWGIAGLPELGEIYPLGGSGDRLGLIDKETGHSLPVAMLPYCGRTLLEGLIRDLQAREFLYYKVYGKQHITPVAIMTSAAKDNHQHIIALCEKHEWFGRGRRRFQLFEQPLVPIVGAEDGQWVTREPLNLVLKPGGHGVIWKLASNKGIFKWFYSHGCKAATVRQISNPVAATDVTLLALAGVGLRNRKKLGFASCHRNVGATEGVNVLVERNTTDGYWEYGVTCIEYTEFDKLGIADAPISPGSLQAQFPANTNVLYVDLASVENVGSSKSKESLPGMILNLKKPICYEDYLGVKHSIYAGRLECTMQNVADSLFTRFPCRCYSTVEEHLDTFIVFNERRKVTSSAKRQKKEKDRSLHQTPYGSFLDITRNAYDLLVSCNVQMDKVEDNTSHLQSGPAYLIFLHPTLGPLWEVVRQKFHGGSVAKHSELQLEIAEFSWRNVELDGSLIILAENAMGSLKASENDEMVLQYGQKCGKCRLHNVKISNKGVDWTCSENVFWQHKVHRLETVKIVLHGNAEFDACDVVLEGDHYFEVPNGHRLQITSRNSGLSSKMQPIKDEMSECGSWLWKYTLQNSHIHLEMIEL